MFAGLEAAGRGLLQRISRMLHFLRSSSNLEALFKSHEMVVPFDL
jgi:hypothetical protein